MFISYQLSEVSEISQSNERFKFKKAWVFRAAKFSSHFTEVSFVAGMIAGLLLHQRRQ
jgi:hypothetical protein